MVQPKANIVQLPVYQPGKPIEDVKREYGLTDIIKLASNENPYGCSPMAKQAITDELSRTNLYPDGAALALTQALAAHLGVGEDQLIFGAGSDEVILMICRAYLTQGDETIVATHTFPIYKHNAQVEGATVIEVPLREGKHDLQAMLDEVTDKTKIIWICNPNNPTGTIVTHAEVEAFLRHVSRDVMVVLDEAYIEYNTSPDCPDSMALLREHDNLVLLRTFSKIYGLASLRIGYAIAHPPVIRNVNQVREPFNTTRYAQVAAKAAIQDQAFVEKCRQANAQGLGYLQQQFTRMGLSYYPAYGNFIMVDTGKRAELVFEELLRRGIIIRGGHQLGFGTMLRVTVGTPTQNAQFITALEQVLSEIAVQA